VLEDDQALAEMLRHAKGSRQVPVIIENGKVTIGFGGS
jgi:glutaredoxin